MVRDNDLDGALKNLNALIQSDPKNVNAYVLRGQVYSQKKQPDLEANDFQTAHLLEPNNPIVNFDVAEVKFTQKSYDAARIGFTDLAKDPSSLIGGLALYKVFLCDLFGNHPDIASQEFDAINKIGSGAPYYYANAAWSLFHHQTEDARGWLTSASQIYTPEKNTLYSRSLADLGYLPLPPPLAAH